MFSFLRAARTTTLALGLSFALFGILDADCLAKQSGVVAWRSAHAVIDRMMSQHMISRKGVEYNQDKHFVIETYSVREYDLDILFVYDEGKTTWGLAFVPKTNAMKARIGAYGTSLTSTTCYNKETDDPFILSVQSKIVSHR